MSFEVEKDNLNKKEQRVAQLLFRYMVDHPEAKHTTEGIAKWWILEQKLEEEMAVIKNVISHFIDVGLLKEVELPQKKNYLKINLEKINQCRKILNNLQQENKNYNNSKEDE